MQLLAVKLCNRESFLRYKVISACIARFADF